MAGRPRGLPDVSSPATYSTFARLSEFDGLHSDSDVEADEVKASDDSPVTVEGINEGSSSLIRGIIRGGVVLMLLATLSVLAFSTSQAFPNTRFSGIVSAVASFGSLTDSSSEEDSNGATSVSTVITTSTTNTGLGGTSGGDDDDGDFLSGFDVDLGSTDVGDDGGISVGNSTEIVETTTESTVLKWSMTRSGYSPIILDNDLLRYRIFDSVDSIIEPYATNGLFVTEISDSVMYRYQLCPEETGSDCYYGTLSLNKLMTEEVEIECEPYDLFTMTIKEYNSKSGEETNNYEGTVMCMYVRREIRGLSDDDLTSSLDAMYALWSTDEEDGQELYGENFHSASYLLKIHHFNAAWQDSDHIHEGNGFLAQHIKMTNIFELSMQSVDPSVTLPYWDFTIDASQGLTAFQSVVMTEDTFGSMTMPSNVSWGFTYEADNITSGAIPDGRWAFLKSPSNVEYPDLQAGYNYMRAPWNMNPSPYVSRFTYDYQVGISLPTCNQHYAILNEDTLAGFMYNMQNDPHATTHSLSGGIYGCDLMTPMLEAGYLQNELQQKVLCAKWVFYLKEFYRYGYIAPKTDCEVTDGVQSSTCGFDCSTDTKVLNGFMSNMQTKLSTYVPSDMSVDGWYAWYDFVCTGDGGKIFSGDHLESASPHDPSFWVIHPTLERLYHAKMMAGGFKDSTWPTDPVEDFVCDKAQCYDEGIVGVAYGSECCYGHFENDQFLDFLSGNRSSHVGDTNGEIMKASDPSSSLDYSVPYIYDSLYWNHCSDDFTSLLTDLKETMDSYQLTSSKNLWLATQPTLAPTRTMAPSTIGHSKPTKLPTSSPDKKSGGGDKKSRGSSKATSKSKDKSEDKPEGKKDKKDKSNGGK